MDQEKKRNRWRIKRKKYVAAHPERVKDSKHRSYVKWRDNKREYNRLYYRSKVEADNSYAVLLKNQHGVCAICKNPETKTNKYGTVFSLAHDHNHVTGRYRGLLCVRCNMLLGKVHDNPEILSNAARYLRKWTKFHSINGD